MLCAQYHPKFSLITTRCMGSPKLIAGGNYSLCRSPPTRAQLRADFYTIDQARARNV
jgi:hypothetical protein